MKGKDLGNLRAMMSPQQEERIVEIPDTQYSSTALSGSGPIYFDILLTKLSGIGTGKGFFSDIS